MHRRSPLIILVVALATAFTIPASATDSPTERAPRIVGGSETDPGDFPFVAAVVDHFAEDAWLGHMCGASVIGRRHVLTTTACVAWPS